MLCSAVMLEECITVIIFPISSPTTQRKCSAVRYSLSQSVKRVAAYLHRQFSPYVGVRYRNVLPTWHRLLCRRIAYSSGLSFAVIQAGQMNGKEPQASAPYYGWYSQYDWTAGASRRWHSEVFLAPLTEITNFFFKSLLFIEFPVICVSHLKIVERRLIFFI